MDNIYSTKEAATKLKLSEAHVRRLLEGGQIPGKKLGRDWIVFSLEYKRKRKAKKRLNQPVNLATDQS